MRNLKVKSASWVLLALLLGIMVAVFVLPEVDLPDTAFYTNTAPALVHARVIASRAQLNTVVLLLVSLFPLFWFFTARTISFLSCIAACSVSPQLSQDAQVRSCVWSGGAASVLTGNLGKDPDLCCPFFILLFA
jgi:hypothetical protein